MRQRSGSSSWRKSSYSGSGGSNCLEFRLLGHHRVAVRNSTHPQGGTLVFSDAAWRSFVAAVKAGEFHDER